MFDSVFRNIVELFNALSQVLDTPSKKVLWKFILAKLSAPHQEFCVTRINHPQHILMGEEYPTNPNTTTTPPHPTPHPITTHIVGEESTLQSPSSQHYHHPTSQHIWVRIVPYNHHHTPILPTPPHPTYSSSFSISQHLKKIYFNEC